MPPLSWKRGGGVWTSTERKMMIRFQWTVTDDEGEVVYQLDVTTRDLRALAPLVVNAVDEVDSEKQGYDGYDGYDFAADVVRNTGGMEKIGWMLSSITSGAKADPDNSILSINVSKRLTDISANHRVSKYLNIIDDTEGGTDE